MEKILLDLHEVLGENILAKILNRKQTTLQKMLDAPNQIPTSVEDRLNFLNAVIKNLKGSYNYYGICRWFQRERVQLNGKSPIDLLSGNWWPRDPKVLEILKLSSSLVG